jgi:hypothetical protein
MLVEKGYLEFAYLGSLPVPALVSGDQGYFPALVCVCRNNEPNGPF